MNLTIFSVQMDRLAGLRFRPADLTTHWEALRDLPDAVLEAAVTRAQRSRVEFPTPVELRQDADAVAHHARPVEPPEDRSTPLAQPFSITVPEAGTVVSITREWRYYCEDCSDGGWVSRWCGDPVVTLKDGETRTLAKPWQEQRVCDRRGEHFPHEWVERCPCFDTNPELVRKRKLAQKFAEKAATVRT